MARNPQAPRSPPSGRKPLKLTQEALAPLVDCTARTARLAARRLTAFYDARLAQTGLSIAQFGLMAQIAGAEDAALGALADRMGLEASTLTRNLQALAREGLAEIVTAGSDQRRRTVRLTQKGEHALAAALPVWAKAQAEAAAVVDAKALRTIARNTRKLPV
ncbi:MAG: MarR family winged helix-turn-helix transcriptional regulator [Hyphomonadaceae bacterium]|nr:MarR family winged helix-turn-helix transcriptional regulator [Hyphomonadaceae bacterium]